MPARIAMVKAGCSISRIKSIDTVGTWKDGKDEDNSP